MAQSKPALVLGADGSLGRRISEILFSLGIEYIPAKWSGSMKQDITGNPIDFQGREIYLIDGPDLSGRVKEAERSGFRVAGKVSDLNPENLSAVFDVGHKNGTIYNFANNIHPVGVPLLVQGGTPLEKSFGLNTFASIPSAVGDTGYGRFPRAKQVSCNATWTSTALTLAQQSLGKTLGEISYVILNLQRRFADTEDGEKFFNPQDMKMVHSRKYEEDVSSVLPSVQDKIITYASKNDWRTCHYGTIVILSSESINLDTVKETFANYKRAVLLEQDLASAGVKEGMEKIITLGEKLGLPDGDVAIPLYHPSLLDRNILCISGYNPQRSITLPSSIDWYWSVTNKCGDWQESFSKTNAEMKLYGVKIPEIKSFLEHELNR